MLKIKLIFFLLLTLNVFPQYSNLNIDNYIQDAAVFQENQLPLLPTLISFDSYKSAIAESETQSGFYQSLNGKWKFKLENTPYTFPKDFYQIDFDDTNWDEIKVPSVWQTQGYDHLMYRNIPMEFAPYDPPKVPKELNPTGCYKRIFDVDKNWDGRKIILHFDGVKSNAFVWLNGKYLGYDEGGMTPAEFDITDFIVNENNQITVLVMRWSDGSYMEDQDMWRCSGIFRDVYIYSKPSVSISDLIVITDFDDVYKDAELTLKVAINPSSSLNKDYNIKFTLFDSSKTKIIDDISSIENQNSTITKKIEQPHQWSDEKPYLYTLIVELLNSENDVVDIIKKRIGFRELQMINGKTCLNGKPIYIKGVNRHEHDPDLVRTISKEMMLKDILLMKQNNINAVRGSHYPDSPLWYELCDEYGILLQDEVNAECHYGENWFPDLEIYHDAFMDRFIGMVQRDKNHPSVIMWSTGNECGLGQVHFDMNDYARKTDPTRFIMHQANGHNGDAPYADIMGPRYPTISKLRYFAMTTGKPIVMGEYAHGMGNSLGHFDEFWDLIYSMGKLQGGFIWDWADQGLNRELILTPDRSRNNITSAVIGNPSFIDGKKGKAVKLSGLDDWIEIYNHPEFDKLTNNITIEFWVKPDEWFIENPIVTRANQFGITQRHPDSLSFYINDYMNSITTVLPSNWNNNWHRIKAAYDGEEMKLLINNEVKASKTYSGNFIYSEYPVNVGRNYSKNTDQHLGWISNCAIDEVVISRVMNDQTDTLLYLPFDETSLSGNFVYYGASSFDCNGVIFHDRTPQPELYQVKKSQAPVKFKMDGNEIKINNHYSFTNLNELDFNWLLYNNGKLVNNGSIEVDCPPLSQVTIDNPFKQKQLTNNGEYILELTANLKEAKPWAPKGHEINFEQFVLSENQPYKIRNEKDSEIEIEENVDEIFIKTEKVEYAINKTNGEFSVNGNSNVVISGPELNVWRAPISNELVDWGRNESKAWYSSGLNRLILDSTDFHFNKSVNHVNFFVKKFYLLPGNEDYICNQFVYTIYSSGTVKINQKTSFLGYFNYDWLPRIGMKFNVAKSFNNVSWYGRGPFENYPDRKTGAKIGSYTLSVDSFYVPYVQPEDYGNRTDVRFLKLLSDEGKSFSITSDEKFNFSVGQYSNIDRAVYPFQLIEDGMLTLNIDHKVTGVGGTPVPTLPKYRVYPVDYDYSVILIPE